MARRVNFKTLQGDAASLNEANVRVYGVRVRNITIGTLDDVAQRLHFEPDDGIYAYVPNITDYSIAEVPVNYVLVYWSHTAGKVTFRNG